jgi:hypothetical protein
MHMTYPQQEIRFEPLGQQRLDELLRLTPPPGVAPERAFKQLRRIEEYVLDQEVGAGTVVIEGHYIDRDFMEDYSVFYSRSLQLYKNSCQRLHFFRGSPEETAKRIDDLVLLGRKSLAERAEFEGKAREISESFYCGFSVIKPLSGTPVGRTVLRHFPATGSSTTERLFLAARDYRTHLLGLELVVRGLAFQQQDVGVAACATTAIWTALQKTRETEELGPTTPAHITTRATQSRLPFGRSMPSEGLSIDQMCQAVDSFGVSPVLHKVESFRTAQLEIFGAAYSGLAPVLIIKQSEGRERHHAVTVVGMNLKRERKEHSKGDLLLDAEGLNAVYIHDDRHGPYLRARLEHEPLHVTPGLELRTLSERVMLQIRTAKALPMFGRATDETEKWQITHILTPMHVKVRLSISEMYKLASGTVAKCIGAAWQTIAGADGLEQPLRLLLWIARSHEHVSRLLFKESVFPSDLVQSFARKVPLARYVGIMRFHVLNIATLDVVVDTTSTFRNPAFLACMCVTSDERAIRVARALAEVLACPLYSAPSR